MKMEVECMMKKEKGDAGEVRRFFIIIPLVINSRCFLFFSGKIFLTETEGEKMEWNVDWEGTTVPSQPDQHYHQQADAI